MKPFMYALFLTHYNQQQGNISSIFSSNYEASTSELLEKLDEMFPQYYMHSSVLVC